MQSLNEQERFDFAKQLIIEAGDLAMRYFGNLSELSIMSKGARDMVSEADIAVEKLIKKRLLAAYPDDAYLGEETGHVKGGDDSGIWVVDPIDGTQPFLSGLSSWCISIAYVQANNVLLGVVNNPAAGELFSGGVGRAAELNGRAKHSHWLPASPTSGVIRGSARNRLFPSSTACCVRAECFFVTALVHSGSVMLLVGA